MAEASWEVFDGAGEWELDGVWAEKREVFYEAAKRNPTPVDDVMYIPWPVQSIHASNQAL